MNVVARPNYLETYHYAWLSVHPERTPEWLKDRMRDGFHIHHVDGDHSNDDPANLVLIDGVDHMRLHGMKLVDGILRWRAKARAPARSSPSKASVQAKEVYEMKAEIGGTWAEFAKVYHGDVKPSSRPWSDIGAGLANKARKHAVSSGLAWPLADGNGFARKPEIGAKWPN